MEAEEAGEDAVLHGTVFCLFPVNQGRKGGGSNGGNFF